MSATLKEIDGNHDISELFENCKNKKARHIEEAKKLDLMIGSILKSIQGDSNC